jgi:plasmid stability protein
MLSTTYIDSIGVMRQLLLRVPEELHRRLAARAQREGRSVNALATEILGTSVDTDIGSAGDVVRARAAAAGLLRVVEAPPPEATASREEVHRLLADAALSAEQLIDEQRGRG